MKHVVVVGAGLGGLAAAIRLSRRGYRVTVLEKNDRAGGKMDVRRSHGYTFDTGPTLLTMPWVLDELFRDAGCRREDVLELVPLSPLCRYHFADGERLDTFSDLDATAREIGRLSPDDVIGFREFMAHAARIYAAAAEPFLFSPFGSLSPGGLLRAARHLPALLRIDAFRTLDAAVCRSFADPRLRQVFNRFATYNGSSPYRTPATLAIIPHVEFSMGGWYVRGGLHRVAHALEDLARTNGVAIEFDSEVARISTRGRNAAGVVLKGGDAVGADCVVVNADALTAQESLLASTGARIDRFRGVEPSLSGFVMLLGVRRVFPALAHHSIFFSADYRREFEQLFGDRRPADDPTVYVSVSSLVDSGHAPPAASNLFLLVNAPAVGPEFDWTQEGGGYRATILRRLARSGIDLRPEEIEVEMTLTPLDFQRLYHAHQGAIYGTSSNGRTAAFLRPPNRSRDLRGLYFVGGSSHPGGGIPLVLLSGKIVADLVAKDFP